ncbi:hypothetical protein [Azospirillum doebereinerae]
MSLKTPRGFVRKAVVGLVVVPGGSAAAFRIRLLQYFYCLKVTALRGGKG